MDGNKENKKRGRPANGLTAQDVADLFQSAAWYASQNNIPLTTETGADGLVIRLPTLEAVTGEDGLMRYIPKPISQA